MRRSLALAVVTALAAIAGIAGAGGAAETYPSRTITMSVPYAPGGPLDTLARILAERLRPVLGQTVIIENVGGAGGSIGVGRVVRSAPDGYTIGAGNWGSHVANVAIYQLPYDVLKDLDPVTLLPVEPNVIVARKALPPNNLKELIAWLKQNPDAATAGTSGVGGPSHMSAIFFEQQTGTRIRLVPYRGSGPGPAGPRRRTDRPHDHRTIDRAAACDERCHQGLCGDRQDAPHRDARHSDDR
jgi:tripartite-type tricarboxylate transporter receptor subunit TctC